MIGTSRRGAPSLTLGGRTAWRARGRCPRQIPTWPSPPAAEALLHHACRLLASHGMADAAVKAAACIFNPVHGVAALAHAEGWLAVGWENVGVSQTPYFGGARCAVKCGLGVLLLTPVSGLGGR